MTKFYSLLKSSLFIVTSMLLTGCKDDIADAVGFWKADDKNFIEISEDDGTYSAIVYRPSSWDSTFEKAEYPATYEEGIVSIGLPSGPLPILHRAGDDVIVVFGEVIYARVDADQTRIEVDTMLKQIELDNSDCEALQEQVNTARGTFEDNDACQAFMTPIFEQKPASCQLLFTSCNSF